MNVFGEKWALEWVLMRGLDLMLGSDFGGCCGSKRRKWQNQGGTGLLAPRRV